jgi:CDP-glucose 4,6-dehydratase
VEGVVMLDFYKGKTILITGHTGFKGSWLSEILLDAGANVIGLSLKPETNPNLFDICSLDKRMISIIGDIRDYQLVYDLVSKYRPEIVFHLAAQPIVLRGYKDPVYTYETNVLGTLNLLECIRIIGCVKSFLNITTDKVYENNDLKNHPFSEEEKLDGFDPYSNSKSCSELVTHCYKNSFFKDTNTSISTARAGNVIGGGDFSENRIIPDCVRAAILKKPVLIRNSYSIRPYQFVLEPLFGYLLIAEKQYGNKSVSGYYNIGPDASDAKTTKDLVTIFSQKWGNDFRFLDQSDPNAPHEAGYLELNCGKIKKTFGWKPILSVEQAIDNVVSWTKSYYFGGKDESVKEMKRQIADFLLRLNECNLS